MSRTPSRRARLARRLVVAAVVLVLLHAGAERLAAFVLARELVGSDAGRTVGLSLARATVRLRRDVQVELDGLEVAMPEGVNAGRTLLRVSRVSTAISLTELLRHGAAAAARATVRVEGASLALPIDADGRAALARALTRWQARTRRTTTTAGRARSRAPFASLTLTGGAVALYAHGAPVGEPSQRPALRGLTLTATHDPPHDSWSIRAQGALLGRDDALSVRASLDAQRALGDLELRVGPVALDAARPFVQPTATRFTEGLGDLSLALSLGADDGQHARALRLQTRLVTGPALGRRALEAEGTGVLRAHEGAFVLSDLSLALGDDVRVALEGSLRRVNEGGELTVALRSVDARIERWLAVLASIEGHALPLQAQGPFALTVRATAATESHRSQLALHAALDDAELALGPSIRKPAAMPLALDARGVLSTDQTAHLDEATVRLGTATLTVREAELSRARQQGSFALAVPDVPALTALAPALAGLLARQGVSLRGATIEGALSHDATHAQLELEGQLTGARVQRGPLRGEGALSTRLRLTRTHGTQGTPATLDAHATLDATRAHLSFASAYDKPATRPLTLSLALRGSEGASRVQVSTLELRSPGLRVDAQGSFDRARGAIDLTRAALHASLDELGTVAPALARAGLPEPLRGGSLDATLQARGSLRGALEGALRVGRAESPFGTILGEIQGTVRQDQLDLRVHLEGRGRARLGGALEPLRLDARVQRDAGRTLTLTEGAVALPGVELARLEATLANGAREATLRTPSVRLDADALTSWAFTGRAFSPALRGLRATLGLEARVRRDAPNRPLLRVYDLDARGIFGDVGGELSLVEGFPYSRVRFALRSEHLDFTALERTATPPRDEAPAAAAAAGTETEPAAHGTAAPRLPLWARMLNGAGTLDVRRLDAGGYALRALHFDGGFTTGRLEANTLRFELGGGTVTADGSYLDLRNDTPSARMNVRTGWISLERALPPSTETRGEAHTPAPGPSGLVLLEADLRASGADAASFRASMRGALEFAAHDLRFMPPARRRVRIVNPQLARLLERRGGSRATPSFLDSTNPNDPRMHLSWVHAQLELFEGSLRTREPIELALALGTAHFTGTLGFDRRASLEGTMLLDPQALITSTRGRIAPAEAIALPVRIVAQPGQVDIEIESLRDTVRAFVLARLRALFVAPPIPSP